MQLVQRCQGSRVSSLCFVTHALTAGRRPVCQWACLRLQRGAGSKATFSGPVWASCTYRLSSFLLSFFPSFFLSFFFSFFLFNTWSMSVNMGFGREVPKFLPVMSKDKFDFPTNFFPGREEVNEISYRPAVAAGIGIIHNSLSTFTRASSKTESTLATRPLETSATA
ncbi:hypothetical protein LX36DRAFT_263961 [Colletotrichum falcatum]|nr:hypothetical protein LX36DRAFT_263961 [Colletotrichum falcatum]